MRDRVAEVGGVLTVESAPGAGTVVAEAADGAEAVRQVGLVPTDLVLMDLQLGEGIDGVEATRRVLALPDPPRVLVLTIYDSDADISRAIAAGAAGYLLKAGPPEELFRSVRTAARGETALSPRVATRTAAVAAAVERRLIRLPG
ncbi:response regulator [Actinomadura sp. NAK00032]|nr:response regulator [Actinomadura sp. NAK00032]